MRCLHHSLVPFSPSTKNNQDYFLAKSVLMPINILPSMNLGRLETLLLRWLRAISKKALFYCLLLFLWNHSFKRKAIVFCKIHISMKSKWVYLYILVRFRGLHSVFGAIFSVECFQSRQCPRDIVLILLSKGRKWS